MLMAIYWRLAKPDVLYMFSLVFIRTYSNIQNFNIVMYTFFFFFLFISIYIKQQF
jgi:hypothetical protein